MGLNRSKCLFLFILFFDVLALFCAWHLTFELRLFLDYLMPVHLTRGTLLKLVPPVSSIVVLWCATALWLGLYERQETFSLRLLVLRVGESVIIVGALLIVLAYFYADFTNSLPRSFVLAFMPVNFVAQMAGRVLAAYFSTLVEFRWPSKERVAILGTEAELTAKYPYIDEWQTLNGKIVGAIVPESSSTSYISRTLRVLGTVDRLAEHINNAKLSRIILFPEHLAPQTSENCARIAKRMGIVVTRYLGAAEPDARLRFSAVNGMQVLEITPVYFTRTQEIVKRSFDVVCGTIVLVLLWPVLIAIALAVKLTSEGPVLHRSWRVGRGGKHFQFLKFRSMYVQELSRNELMSLNEKRGHLFKIKHDPRITPVGRILRRYSLDELPQLFNVLRGEMSLIGPRPLPAEDLAPDGLSREHAEWAEQRSRVLPGITGLWQVSGRSDLTFDEMTKLDEYYIQNWSLLLDLRILAHTPFVVLSGQGAC